MAGLSSVALAAAPNFDTASMRVGCALKGIPQRTYHLGMSLAQPPSALEIAANHLTMPSMSQLDLFPQASEAVSPVPSVDAVRARFEELLARLRAATLDLPLTERELAYWRVVTPQMANWLPAAEREAVCTEFADHVSRLGNAAA